MWSVVLQLTITVAVSQGPMAEDLNTLCLTSLRTVIQTFATMNRHSALTVCRWSMLMLLLY